MDCERFVDELRKDVAPYEIVQEIEEHAQNCSACGTLLKYWSFNQLDSGFKNRL